MISAIADLHLRDDTPISRKDSYYTTMLGKLDFCLRQAPTMLVAGDFFHSARSSMRLLSDVIYLIREAGTEVIVIPGQHDLPGHNLSLVHHSGLGVLAEAGVVRLMLDEPKQIRIHLESKPVFYKIKIWPVPFGQEVVIPKEKSEIPDILLIHKLIFLNKQEVFPGIENPDICIDFMKKYPQFDLIISGDNHNQFFIKENNKRTLLINTGSMMRQKIDQKDHRPAIALIDENLNVAIKAIPIEQDVWKEVSVEPVVDNSLVRFFVDELKKLDAAEGVNKLNSSERIKAVLAQLDLHPEVKQLIYDSIEVVKI
jgi:DNA repair exonuclease SbcCD nuclease subunit